MNARKRSEPPEDPWTEAHRRWAAPDDCRRCGDITPHEFVLVETSRRGLLGLPGKPAGVVRLVHRACIPCRSRWRELLRAEQPASEPA